MKALVVGAAPHPGTAALLATIVHEVDVVIAADGGAAVCWEAGVVPEVIVGDMDSLEPGVRDELAARGSQLRVYPADKDVTDLDLALAEAGLRGATEVVVTAAFGQRLDHTLAAMGSLARRADLKPEIVEPEQRGWVLSTDGRASVALAEPETMFSIVSLGEPATVSASGVRWPLAEATLPPLSSWAISNVTEQKHARVAVSAGTAIVLVLRQGALSADEG